VDAYLPLVRRVVRQLARRLPSNVQRDDLLAAGVFGLVDSLRRNGGDGGAAFEWYARTRIRGAIFDELRAQDWLSRRARAGAGVAACFVSFEEVANDESGLAGTDDPSEAFESRSLRRALARALKQLPERERTVVARYYFEGARLKDISAELGVSEPRISQILARAIERLRVLLQTEAA
jgi:RNA polymerase sigma factor for flagellar operon FliA